MRHWLRDNERPFAASKSLFKIEGPARFPHAHQIFLRTGEAQDHIVGEHALRHRFELLDEALRTFVEVREQIAQELIEIDASELIEQLACGRETGGNHAPARSCDPWPGNSAP